MPSSAKLHKFKNRYLLKRSISYFKPYKFRVVVAIIAMLCYAPIPPALAWLGKFITDDVLIAKDISMLKLCIIGFAGLYVLKCILMLGQVYVMNSTGILVLRDLRRALFKKILRLPMPLFRRKPGRHAHEAESWPTWSRCAFACRAR